MLLIGRRCGRGSGFSGGRITLLLIGRRRGRGSGFSDSSRCRRQCDGDADGGNGRGGGEMPCAADTATRPGEVVLCTQQRRGAECVREQ